MYILKSTPVRHNSSLEAAIPDTKTSSHPLARDDHNLYAVLFI